MVLDNIIKAKLEELKKQREIMPLSQLRSSIATQPPPLNFASALCGNSIRLIAEVKMASPSKGLIYPSLNPVKLAKTYAQNGASAISVLTERSYFQGCLEHLSAVKAELSQQRIPLLRKDFIFDPYQVYETRAHGADALLLIVAILNREKLQELLLLSHKLGMQCLVEVHSEAELDIALASGTQIIGINNRDLKTLAVDIATTKRLCPLIPPDRIIVSESGIKERADVLRLREWGVNAILVGEALITSPDIGAKMRELLI